MQNWWIAVLEHAGILTHEEADHISTEIRSTIHKENYKEAVREIETILGSGKFIEKFNKYKKLAEDLKILEYKVRQLEGKKIAEVVSNRPAIVSIKK